MPVWEAQYIMVIASRTGWPESFIRHDLPMQRGWAYYHAARLMEGEKCRWPGKASTVDRWVDRIRLWWERR